MTPLAKADGGDVVVMLGDRVLLRMAPEQAVVLLTELSYAINQTGIRVGVTTS